ncbi:HAMP domain-containing histidine kinase [Deferrisoma camini]|uniref:HAMP domain-containing histidine kinase n=1 Tax=Deferrisoma camini TaxID=1035120 RepID=UPI00046D2554|nr:HAMP domain-containing histidine kinase [Deferrisoma camini]
MGLPAKLLLGFLVLSLAPIAVMTGLSLKHLVTIQATAVDETRALLISAQINRMTERLAQESTRLASVFQRLRDEIHVVQRFAEAFRADPEAFPYRNGSRYRIAPDGSYGNPDDDGNSVLFVPRYRPDLTRLARATEVFDVVARPLVEREERIVLAWIILKEGLTRAYPWRDFGDMPREKDYTTWPFYYLADPSHNPAREEVFTDLYLDPLSGEWMISCLAPVYVGGDHVATVGMDVTVDNLLRDIAAIRLSPDSSSALLSGNRILAASENFPLAALGLDPSRPAHGQDLGEAGEPEVAALFASLPGTGEGVRFLKGGGRWFVGAATVAPPGWRIAILVPEDDVVGPAYESAGRILSETDRIRSNFIHILVFSTLGVLGLTWLVAVHQSRGLRTLLRGIRRIGEGDLKYRLPEGPGDAGRLASALNSMAEGLQQKKRELERVYAEVEQERKLSAVGRLAAGVAHEVNTPLATIATYAQLLRRRPDLPPEVQDDLNVVLGEVRRIQDKVGGLLDLARLEGPCRVSADLNRLVQDVVGLARHEAEARGCLLRTQLDPALPAVRVDRSGMKQVLWNLIGNALDAQGAGGAVWVRTRGPNGQGPHRVVLEVEDEGPGIPEHLLPKVFEPFFTTKEVGQGTGLGLPVSFRIVRSHGGRMEVENRRPRGCVFRVEIPVEEDP